MELYHILNRGVDKRPIVMDGHDRWRFVHDLWEFNSTEKVTNVFRRSAPKTGKLCAVRQRTLSPIKNQGEPLVQVHAWCLMKNHYHLLLSPVIEKGISEFAKKLNGGYSQYFNIRHGREGTLWQGKVKKILIKDDAHFLHILNYIHLNPLDYLKGAQDWRSGRIHDTHEALQHLDSYRWSSYLDYYKRKNIPSIIDPTLFAPMIKEGMFDIEIILSDYAEQGLSLTKALRLE